MLKKACVFLLLVIFVLTNGMGPVYAQQVLELPAPGTRLELSPTFAPPLLKGIKVYRNNPFRFDFILDKGGSTETDDQLKTDSNHLIKYFLASLTVPEKDLWFNLSPYEKDRIVPDAFGQTEMGRDLLAQDYILKQITASVIYPEGKVGKEFWAKVYAEAEKRYGTTDIPADAFNKVWIVPERATVYENKDAAFVVESKLKVMLEEDYLALEKNAQTKQDAPATIKLGSDIVREVVIPILEKEVNQGRNFASLRQVYHSLILAAWYKRKIKESVLSQAYVDREKTGGIDIADKQEKEKIWEQYVEAFKKGAFNFIKEERDPLTDQTIPRKYFSGGTSFNDAAMNTALAFTADAAVLTVQKTEKLLRLSVDLRLAPVSPGRDRAMTATGAASAAYPTKYTDGLGHLRMDAFSWPAVAWTGDLPPQKVTFMDEALSKEVIQALQAAGYLNQNLGFTSKLDLSVDYDRWNDWGMDEVDGKPLPAFLGVDRKFSMIYGDILAILKWAAEEMEAPSTPQALPERTEAEVAGQSQLLRQVVWPVQLDTPAGTVSYLVSLRNEFNGVAVVNGTKQIYYELFLTPAKEHARRGVVWDDRRGGVLLKFDDHNSLSNRSLEIQIGKKFREQFPWLFAFVKDRLTERLGKPFIRTDADFRDTLSREGEYLVDQADHDFTLLEEEYEGQFMSFLDTLLAVDGLDAGRLNGIVAHDGKLNGAPWNYSAVKTLRTMFNHYLQHIWDNDKQIGLLRFPALSGLWQKLDAERPKDVFGFISEWMIQRFKELSADPDGEQKLVQLTIDATRFVQMVIVEEYGYLAESGSMADLLSHRGWNCLSISCLTAVLMGLWGARGVSVVRVKQLADGTTFPLPGGIGHAANLVRVGRMAAYLDQGAPPQFTKVRLIVYANGWAKFLNVEDLPRYPGVQGMTLDRLAEYNRARNDLKAIQEKINRLPGAAKIVRGTLLVVNAENAGKVIATLNPLINALVEISSRMIVEPDGPISVTDLDPGFRSDIEGTLKKLMRALMDSEKISGKSGMDSAMAKGGIDLAADKISLEVKNSGEGIEFDLDPDILQRIQNAAGITPVVIGLQPLESLSEFLGAPTF